MKPLDIPHVYQELYWWTHNPKPPYTYYCYSGGRSSGKSTSIAQSLIMRAAMQTILVLCTREFQISIKDSVHALLASQIQQLEIPGFTVTRDEIRHINGSSFIFKGLHNNVQNVKSTEGVDVCWVEEAQMVTKESLDVLDPTIRNPNSTLIFSWNPLKVTDPVWTEFVATDNTARKALTLHKHTTYRDVETLLSASMLQKIEAAKGTPEFEHVYEGMPLSDLVNQVIDARALYACLEVEPEPGLRVLGVDVARTGSDRTVVCLKDGNTVRNMKAWSRASLVESACEIRRIVEEYKVDLVRIDDTGVGGGLTDILQQHLPGMVQPVNYARRARNPRKYPNVASELWFDFAENMGGIRVERGLPFWSELVAELTTRSWSIDSRDRRVVESKKSWRKGQQGAGSPDIADAFLLACYPVRELPDYNVSVV